MGVLLPSWLAILLPLGELALERVLEFPARGKMSFKQFQQRRAKLGKSSESLADLILRGTKRVPNKGGSNICRNEGLNLIDVSAVYDPHSVGAPYITLMLVIFHMLVYSKNAGDDGIKDLAIVSELFVACAYLHARARKLMLVASM